MKAFLIILFQSQENSRRCEVSGRERIESSFLIIEMEDNGKLFVAAGRGGRGIWKGAEVTDNQRDTGA